MAYTEAQWNQLQASLPPEERMPYIEYLRVTDPVAYNSLVLKGLKADSASTPITVVDEQTKIAAMRAATAAAPKTATTTTGLTSAQKQAAVRKLTAGQALNDAEMAYLNIKPTTAPTTTTTTPTTPTTTPKSAEQIEAEKALAEAKAQQEKILAAKAKFDKKEPLTAEEKALLGIPANFEYNIPSTTTTGKTPELIALEKAAADAEAQNQKVKAAKAKFDNKQPLTAEEKALLNLGADFEYTAATPNTVITTDTATSTGTGTGKVFTQSELDAAVKAAQDKAIAELKAKTEQEKRDAEIAAAAALAAANNKGSLTQQDLDRAIREALAQQEAKAAAQAREAKAAEDAKALAQKQKASDRLVSIFTGYGLETLAGFIDRRIKEDISEDMLMLELYDQPEYQLRFPGMKALRAKNRTITESDYMKIENQYTQAARFFDLPKGFYDSPDDFGKLIGNEVSATEFQNRLQVGQDLARAMSPAARTQLQEFYNIGEGGITAYVLDADRALPLIQKQAKAAQFVGFGREKGFKLEGMTAAQAEQIAGTEAYAKLSGQQLQQALGQAAQLRQTQSRLTGIEGQVYNEQEALSAVIEGSPEALLASQQRAQREGARFGGGSGITGSSLRSTAGI